MTLDELWNSPANAPGPIEREAFVAQTLLRVARERRQRKGMLLFSGILLLLSTVPAVYTRVTDPEALRSSASLYLMLASQWLLILYWARQLRQGGRMTAGEGDTIQDSLARLLWEVEAERRSQLGVVVLFAVFAPLLALAIRQLVASDKMTPDQAMSGGLVFLGIATVSVGTILWRLKYRVLPRRRRLQALLAQFGEAGEVG